MKKILPLTLTLGGVACLIAVAALAADTPPAAAAAPVPPARHGEKSAARLGLSAEQQAKLADLRQAQRTALATLAADQALAPEDRRAKVRDLMAANREQMKAVLTPEQQALMAKAHQRLDAGHAQKPGHGGRGFERRGPGPHRPDKHELQAMAQRAHQQLQHQRERRARQLGLTDDQRAKMRLIAFQHREKTIGLQKEMRAELEAVLSPEQKAKAQEMKAGHGRRGPGHRPDGERLGPPPRPRAD